MRISEAQFHILHLLMLEDAPRADQWFSFKPPLSPIAVRSCEKKGLVEVSERGMRLTDAGRAAYADRY